MLRTICKVNQAGAAGDGTETPVPVIYINLTDTANRPPAFTAQWFHARPDAKNELLAVALSAISAGKLVDAFVDLPTNPGGQPYSEIHRPYLYED